MVAEKQGPHGRKRAVQEGQSVLELLFLLPLLMALAFLLIRVNTVIQMGIVNQQYARAQVLYMAGNADNYPQRPGIVANLTKLSFNQFDVGIAEYNVEIDQENTNSAVASTYPILASAKGAPQDSEAQTEPLQRVNIRVRNTVTMCLPVLSLPGGTPMIQNGLYALNDATRFQYCNSPESAQMDQL